MGASRLTGENHKPEILSDFSRVNADRHYGLKRLCDLLISLLAIIVLAPVMIVISIVLIGLGFHHPIFRQKRVGRHATVFTIFKFRTLRDRTCRRSSAPIIRLSDQFTGWLRTSGLDELPQLINVIRGEMSLVGPRPHSVADHALFATSLPGYDARLAMRPGITGLAQIRGWRGPVDCHHHLRARTGCDLDYIADQNPLRDGIILFATVLLPLRRSSTSRLPARQADHNGQRPGQGHVFRHDQRLV